MIQPERQAQRGVVLFIALIILVAMSLAGIALMRSVDTSNLIAGNLAFKQGATVAGDWGLEKARSWLATTAAADATLLNGNQPAGAGGAGYWANWNGNGGAIDYMGNDPAVADLNWANDAVSVGTDAAGNQVSYVIHRLCVATGDPSSAPTGCVKSTLGGGNETSSKGGVSYTGLTLTQSSSAYYRVTSRIIGPRNTITYVQAVMN